MAFLDTCIVSPHQLKMCIQKNTQKVCHCKQQSLTHLTSDRLCQLWTSALFHLPADLAATLFDQFKAFPQPPWQTPHAFPRFQSLTNLVSRFFYFANKVLRLQENSANFRGAGSIFSHGAFKCYESGWYVLQTYLPDTSELMSRKVHYAPAYEFSRCKLICHRYKGKYKQIHKSYASHTYLPDTSKLLHTFK